MKLQKLQYDQTLIHSTNTAGLQPRQLLNSHDYHMMTHSRTQDTHEHDTYTDSYIARQQQRKLDAILSWQIQAKNIWQNTLGTSKNKRSLGYQQTTLDPPLSNRHMMDKNQKNIIVKEGLKIQIPNLQVSFRDK